MTNSNSQEIQLAAAVQLGWRMVELYARLTGGPVEGLPPADDTLGPSEQLELQLAAAAGLARRAGAGSAADHLESIVAGALADASGREVVSEELCREIRTCHVEVDKCLWAATRGWAAA
ncbi:MAG TPA: hypothetical protein VGF25_17295 [Thermoleophilaceae bacterium]